MRHFAWILIFAPQCFGYISQVTADAAQTPLTRSDNAGIQYYLNNQIVAGATSSASGSSVTVITSDSNPAQAVRQALATWNAVSTANVHFLPLKSTSLGIDASDHQMTIAIGTDVSVLGGPQGALAVTLDSYSVPSGVIVDSDIILNPARTFSTISTVGNVFDLQAVMTHELGHSLGANHTGLLGATMFQFNTLVQRQLSSDDIAFASATYPSTSTPASFGSISGKVTTGSGGSVLLTMFNSTTGETFGGVTAGDGTFNAKVTPGTYQMYAEPLNGVVQPVNLYFTPELTAATLQSTQFSGTVQVSAGATSTANLTASAGPSTLSVPFVAMIAHGAPYQGSINFFAGGPTFVPSGGPVDLLVYGLGFDGTMTTGNFSVFNQAVTVSAVAPDPSGAVVKISGTSVPVMRITLNIATQQSLSLASIFITKGSSTLSLSGALVVGPPTPTTTSQSIVSAASFAGNGTGGGAVSPGGISALFDIPNVPNLGPATPVGNPGYDPYFFLAPVLGGVTVTFDGVPAALFFVYGGQINLQAPFEIAGKTTTKMVVSYLGSASATITVPVLASQPAIFTTCLEGGKEVSCIVNQTADATGNFINGPTSAAARGSTIEVFGTGVGVLPSPGYALVSGGSAPPPPISAQGYTCTIGGVNAPVTFAGWAYTAVGLAQWDVQVPASLTTTGALPIVCTNGTQTTQAGVTVYVN